MSAGAWLFCPTDKCDAAIGPLSVSPQKLRAMARAAGWRKGDFGLQCPACVARDDAVAEFAKTPEGQDARRKFLDGIRARIDEVNASPATPSHSTPQTLPTSPR